MMIHPQETTKRILPSNFQLTGPLFEQNSEQNFHKQLQKDRIEKKQTNTQTKPEILLAMTMLRLDNYRHPQISVANQTCNSNTSSNLHSRTLRSALYQQSLPPTCLDTHELVKIAYVYTAPSPVTESAFSALAYVKNDFFYFRVGGFPHLFHLCKHSALLSLSLKTDLQI